MVGSFIWAVHIADGVLAPITLGLGFAITSVLLLVGCWQLGEKEVAKTGVMTAILFVASLIHPPIPGAKVHLLLNGMAGMLLGMHVGLAVVVALTLQALLLSHGGLLALGVNCTTMGVPALLVACLFGVIRWIIPLNHKLTRWVVGCFLGAVGVLGTVVMYYLVLRFGAITGEDLRTLATIAFIWHGPVLIVETIFSALLLDFLYRIKPELLGIRNHEAIQARSDSDAVQPHGRGEPRCSDGTSA
ncbi:MAG TPA: CbiM family transporter [Gemmatales bacterium]|nr:CbiM family transporter [Gemmatales bacterium]